MNNRVDPNLETREERLANRLASRRRLEPPIDVISLAQSLAHVTEKRFPIGDVDGICLDLKKPGVTPKIWVNLSATHHRRRFTLAHEIGHVIIPWHTGAIIDDLEAGDAGGDEYRWTEHQANRFAAELLMPRAWAANICERAEHLRDAMHAIQQVADVSYHAASLRTTQVGPPGYLLAAVREGYVEWGARTRGTRARAPAYGTRIDAIDMPAFEQPKVLNSPRGEYYFWKELPGVPLGDEPPEPWRDILERMLTNIPVEQRFRTRQRINAIVGSAFGRAPHASSPDVLYQRVLESLQNRSDRDKFLAATLRHPELNQYVLARVHERAKADR